MARSGPALAFSRAAAAFSIALRDSFARARLGRLVDQGMGPVVFELDERGALSMSELAVAARVPKSTMTGIVARMERRGLVRTAPNPRDGRSIMVGLTPRGRAVVPKLRAIERRIDQALRRVVPNGDAERLADLLEEIAGAFGTIQDQ
jgi:DNA-binding MarR family transcriptional regulator